WLALALLVVGFASTFGLRARRSASTQLSDLSEGGRGGRDRGRRPARPPMGASGGGGHVAMPGPAPRNPQVPLRVGILGAGMIATVEPGYLPGLRRLRGRVAVTAIASRTRARAEQVARDWDIPVVCDNLDEMLARGDVDAV